MQSFLTFLGGTGTEYWPKMSRNSPPEVFLGKDVLKICSKFTGEHPRRSVISIKLLCNFIEIIFRHGCSLVNLLHIFRAPFYTNTYGRLHPNGLNWQIFAKDKKMLNQKLFS